MNKIVFWGLLGIILVFGFIGCNGNGDDTYTVTFDLDGGNVSGNTASVNISVKSGESITNLPKPKYGYLKLNGWFTEKNGLGNNFNSSTKVTSNITVYANWIETIAGVWNLTNIQNYKMIITEGVNDYEFICDLNGTYDTKGTIVLNGFSGTFTITHEFENNEWKEGIKTYPLNITGLTSGDELVIEGDANMKFIKE